MKTILCVEDDLLILRNNSLKLKDDGFNVLTAENLAQAREHLAKTTPDVIVLDIMLPDGNGLEYLKELRAEGNKIPVIMLTAWNRSANIAHGLDSGANDYIGKPFEYEVLLARIKAAFRNIEQIPEHLTCGELELCIQSMTATINGEDMLLTQKEFSVLLLFVQNEGRTISAEELYEKVWGQQIAGDKNAVQTAVSKLRQKLEPTKYTIDTKRGQGYIFK